MMQCCLTLFVELLLNANNDVSDAIFELVNYDKYIVSGGHFQVGDMTVARSVPPCVV